MYRILIVDDEVDIALSLAVGLEAQGFFTKLYNDPDLALREFNPHFYDLLLLDIRMPTMSGFELYDRIRKKDKTVKVCFLTSFDIYYRCLHEFLPDIEHHCFIRKPVSIEDPSISIKRDSIIDRS